MLVEDALRKTSIVPYFATQVCCLLELRKLDSQLFQPPCLHKAMSSGLVIIPEIK
jgi:hypothetical protein